MSIKAISYSHTPNQGMVNGEYHPGGSFNLVRPTDFGILYVLADGRQYSATVVADVLERESPYVSSQMGELYRQDLLIRVGNVDRCNIYRINHIGAVVLSHVDKYMNTYTKAHFDQTSRVASAITWTPTQENTSGSTSTVSVTPNPDLWHPNIVYPASNHLHMLEQISQTQPTDPKELADDTIFTFQKTTKFAYYLYYDGLITEPDADCTLTRRGELVLDEVPVKDGSFKTDDATLYQLNQWLLDQDALTVPDWYEPSNFTEAALNPTLPTDIPDFSQN
jgi:hypothetical protein